MPAGRVIGWLALGAFSVTLVAFADDELDGKSLYTERGVCIATVPRPGTLR